MTSTRFLSIVAGAAMALSSAACIYNDYGCKSGDGCCEGNCYVDLRDAGTQPGVCQANSDCAADQYCVKGTCRQIPNDSKTCTVASDCAKGQLCINGVCSALCAKDSDCATGEICKDMFCTPKPVEPAGPDAGTVEPPPAGDDAGAVEPPPPGPDAGATLPGVCHFNADCGEGLYCINSECHLGCASDNDCPAAQMCKVGICQDRPAAECLTGADCAVGQDCVDATCKVRCSTSGQCNAGESCKLGYCNPGSGGACVTNCDCPTSERCVAGVCQP